jgi:hypothetical protein
MALEKSLPMDGGLKTQMMHRKSVAMQTILEAMIRGDLRRVERAAKQLVDYRNTIKHFLSSENYQKYGEDFRKSVDRMCVGYSFRIPFQATDYRCETEGPPQGRANHSAFEPLDEASDIFGTSCFCHTPVAGDRKRRRSRFWPFVGNE